MFLVHLLIGCGTLLLFGQDFGLLSSNVALAKAGDKIIYEVYQEKKTWDEANEECGNKNMVLAYIIKRQEYDALRKHIEDINLLPIDSTSGYWLGGKKDTNGDWIWDMSGISTRVDKNFMAGWLWQEPNGRIRNGVQQGCMELKYKQDTEYERSLGWSDMYCDDRRGYVCQYFGQKRSAR